MQENSLGYTVIVYVPSDLVKNYGERPLAFFLCADGDCFADNFGFHPVVNSAPAGRLFKPLLTNHKSTISSFVKFSAVNVLPCYHLIYNPHVQQCFLILKGFEQSITMNHDNYDEYGVIRERVKAKLH